jgi:Phage integrase family.
MKNRTQKIPLFLSQKEVDDLIRGVRKERHKLGLYLMSYGGLRVSEMCNLKVQMFTCSGTL